MTGALISSDSGAWYAIALAVVVAVLVVGFLLLDALASLPDRWVSEVERRHLEREQVARALTKEGTQR